MNRDTINWILKKLNTGGRIWSIYQRKSIKTASATLWWETTTFPIWSCRRKAAPIGRWGRMHKVFLQEHRPGQYNALLLSGKLWTYLADLNEQAADRLACIVLQMQEAEGVNEELKARNQLAWVRDMNNIRSRAEEIILSEMIFV